MIQSILFIMIGLKLEMPIIYYVLIGISFMLNIISLVIRAYKKRKILW